MGMKTAIICARVSSDDPERDRLEDQLIECRKLAEDDGYTVVEEVIENGISGGLPFSKRPDAARVLGMLCEGKIQAVIWRELDRMGRRYDTAETIEEHQQYGDGILFARQPRLDDPVAEIIQRGIGGVLARWERANIYKRTINGRMRVARDGKGGPVIGSLPPWLRWTGTEYELVEPSASQIRAWCNEYGLVGGETLARRDNVNPKRVYRTLGDPIIAGRRYTLELPETPYPSEQRRRQQRARVRHRLDALRQIASAPTIEEADALAKSLGLFVQEVPTLISWDRFAEIQRRLLASPSAGRRGRPPVTRYPLQGRVFCGKHGLAYTPRHSGGGSRGRPGYIYAVCQRRVASVAQRYGQEPCDYPRIPWVEDTKRGGQSLASMVEEKLREVMASPGGILRIIEDSIACMTAEIDQLEAATGDVAGQIRQLREKKERLGLLWADGDLPDERWESEKARIDRSIGELEHRDRAAASNMERLAHLKAIREESERTKANPAFPPLLSIAFDTVDEMAERFSLRVVVEADRLVIHGDLPVGDIPVVHPKQATRTGLSQAEGSTRATPLYSRGRSGTPPGISPTGFLPLRATIPLQ